MLFNRVTPRVGHHIDLFKEEDSGRGLFIIKRVSAGTTEN